MKGLNILVVDDHQLLTEALGVLLRGLSFVSGFVAASNLKDVMSTLSGYQPDVAMVDLALPDGSGLELFDHLREHAPDCKIILMSGHFSPSQLAQLSRREPDGLFSKADSADELQDAILSIQDGEPYFSSSVAEQLNTTHAGDFFSPRQLEILHLARAGFTNKAIAARLQISASTVAFHLREARQRLKVQTTREALKTARERGIL